MLRPGEELYSINKRYKANVRADVKGSIHQVGAFLEGAPNFNDRTNWCYRKAGKMIPIDVLRQQIRFELDT